MQTAETPFVYVLSVGPSTSITTVPLPPVQETVIPLARVTVALFTGLTRVGKVGMVRFAVKEPTSAPPVPVKVKEPGTRELCPPFRRRLRFGWLEWKLPFGPFREIVAAPSQPDGARERNIAILVQVVIDVAGADGLIVDVGKEKGLRSSDCRWKP